MALFKILKGSGELPAEKHEGWAYVKKIGPDEADFYVDYDNNTRVEIGRHAVSADEATNDSAGNKIDTTYLKLSGGNMNNEAAVKFTKHGNRTLTIDGNAIAFDMSQAPGGWAGDFASIKDPAGKTTTMLGFYGGTSGLTHIWMGGPNDSYSNPAMKMTPDGKFTFKHAIDADILGNAATATKATQDSDGNTINSTYLKRSGGTMNDNAFISWPDSGSWGSSNVTFPLSRGGLYWTGTSDWIRLFAEETSSDMLNLVAQFGDDGSSGIEIRNHSGATTVGLYATGIVSATTFNGALNGNASSATNADMLDGYHESSFLRYSGWWNSGSGQNVNDASGMVFAYNSHGLPGAFGIVTTFDYSKVSNYRHQIYGDGWNNEMYFRTSSSDRGGWNGWRHLLDDSNYAGILDGRYVNVTGDTMTGNLTVPSVYTSNWFRSTGATGWYSETYGGGWYMYDSTYIRNYNSKTVRLDNLCLGADNNSYRLYVNGNQYITGKIISSNSWISIAGTSSFTCPDGTAITQPSGANPLVLYSGAASGRDCGIFYLSNDNAYIANSSDNAYTFGVFDTDVTQDFSSEGNASLCVRSNGAGTFVRNRLGINGINDNYNLYVNGNSYFTDLIYTSAGSHKGVKIGDTYLTAIGGNLILQNNGAIRFGGDSWDWNVWAGLKYVPNNKALYLGLADQNAFDANSVQTFGKLYLPRINYIENGIEDIGGERNYKIVSTYTDGGYHLTTASWFKIANVSGYFNFNINITGGWYSGTPSVATVNICNRNGEVFITQLSGFVGSLSSAIRLGRVSTDNWDVLVLHGGASSDAARSAQYYTFTGVGNITVYQPSGADGTSYGAVKDLTLTSIDGNLLSSGNYTNYTVTKTGGGASGTWGINITGLAAKATADANGLNISTGYLKLSGGTMTGTLQFADNIGIYGSMAGGTDFWKLVGTGSNDSGRCQLIISDNATTDYFDLIFHDYAGTDYTAITASGASINFGVPARFNSGYTHFNDWIQMNGAYGIYWPNNCGLNLMPNNATTYGALRILGQKGGYNGIIFGNDTTGLNVMSSDTHQGLFNENQGRWIVYYNRTSNAIALGGSDVSAGYTVNVNGSLYTSSSAYIAGALGSGTRIFCGYDSGVFGSISCSNWFRSNGDSGWYNVTYGGGWYQTDTTYIRTHGSFQVYSPGRFLAGDTPSTWYDGLKNRAAYKVEACSDSGSYHPWIQQTNNSSGYNFSLGMLGTSFYMIGCPTSQTDNTYTAGLVFDVSNGYLAGLSRVYGAVWNDYAEYRSAETIEPGRVVQESVDGIMKLTTCRLAAGCEIVSDTFGFAIGETDNCKTPVAASGRVLAYTFEDRDSFELGQAVCSGPNGTVSKMTREEIMMYPERIIGTVSEIPTYTTWGTGNVDVNGRIWIRIR